MNTEIGPAAGLGGVRSRLLGGMCGVNVVGAGVPGLVTVLAPGWVADNPFGSPQDPVSPRMLGAVAGHGCPGPAGGGAAGLVATPRARLLGGGEARRTRP